jgi:hypothetical protein
MEVSNQRSQGSHGGIHLELSGFRRVYIVGRSGWNQIVTISSDQAISGREPLNGVRTANVPFVTGSSSIVAVFSVKLAVDDEERSQRYQSTFQSKVPSLALRLIEAGNKTIAALILSEGTDRIKRRTERRERPCK